MIDPAQSACSSIIFLVTDDKDDAGKYQESNSYDVFMRNEDDKINHRSLSDRYLAMTMSEERINKIEEKQ